MSPPAEARRASLAAAALAALGLAAWARALWLAFPYTVDDAFITFRYADVLVHHGRAAFNAVGPPAEGYTSPLWMLACALPLALGLGPVTFSKVAGIGCFLGALAAAGVVTWRLTDRLPPRLRGALAATPALLLGVDPATAIHAVSGMETGAFTLCLAGSSALAVELLERPGERLLRAWAVACLVTGLTRPEGNLFALAQAVALVTLLPAAWRGRAVKALLLAWVLPGAAYFAARWAYYGLPLPLPFYVKVASAGPFAGAKTVQAFLESRGPALLGLAVLGAALHWRRALPATLGLAALLLFFCAPEHVMGFEWRYVFPLAPLLVALAAAAFDGLAALPRRWAPWPGLAATAALLAPAWGLARSAEDRVAPYLAYWRGLEQAHVRLGRALAAHPALKLAIGDAGAAPFYARVETIDTFGLNDPVLARARPWAPDSVLAREPDLVVLISSSPTAFEPHLAHERLLFDAATSRGYARWRTLEFASTYHLWLLVRTDRPQPTLDLGD